MKSYNYILKLIEKTGAEIDKRINKYAEIQKRSTTDPPILRQIEGEVYGYQEIYDALKKTAEKMEKDF